MTHSASTGMNLASSRIRELDILRGVAVLGIFWVNIIVFSLPTAIYSYPTIFSNGNNLNLAVWVFNDVFVEGTMRGIFSMLFGASAMIFLDESRRGTPGLDLVDRFYRRNILLIFFGMFHAYFLLWPYDVLYVYGLLGMFLFPVRKLSARTLLIIGIAFLLLTNITASTEGEVRPAHSAPVSAEEMTAREEFARGRLQMEANEETMFRLADYGTIFKTQVREVILQQSSVIYTTNFFDMGGMMLIGIALLRLGILTGKRSTRFYLGLAFFGYLIGILSRGIPVYNTLTHDTLSLGLPPFDGIDYTFSRLPMALGHISVILLLCRLPVFHWLTQTFALIGRMALTSYLLQSTIAMFVFYGFGLGLFGQLERYELLYVCLGMWLFHASFSLVWLHFFQQGPLEWVWRTLIYGKRQPFRKLSQPDSHAQ